MSVRFKLFVLLALATTLWVIATQLAPERPPDSAGGGVLLLPPAVVFVGGPAPPSDVPERSIKGLAVSGGDAEPDAAGQLRSATTLAQALRERLESTQAGSPATFHADAAQILQDFASAAQSPDAPPRAVLVDALRTEASHVGSAPVYGGLLAAAGGLGQADWLMQASGGEELRSALAGLAWAACDVVDADALVLHPEKFLELQPRAGLPVLALPWSRPPEEPVLDWAWSLVRTPATDLETLLARELAVFLVGTRVDIDPGTLALFRQLLFDLDPRSQQLRPALVYVLAQAHGDGARVVLLDFLADAQAGEHGKTLARWWLSKGVPRAGDVAALITPLLDPRSSPQDRTLSAGTLLARLGDASGDDLAQMEDVLALRALEEEDATARLAAVAVLESVPGGFQRLAALQEVLRRDGKPNLRSAAAHGLGVTPEPFRGEALAQLRAALSTEVDPGVRAMIARMLAEAGG